MLEGGVVKADGVLIRKTFRISDNHLLDLSSKVYLTTCEYEFKNSPFDFKGNYSIQYESERNLFADKLKVRGYSVEMRDPNHEVLSDHLLDDYGLRMTSPFKHQNYLLDSFEMDSERMGFSKFRKIVEKIAFKLHKKPVLDDQCPHVQRFRDYLATDRASSYFETRNALTGENFSTRLSESLNLGQLTPQMIVQLVNEYEQKNGSNKSTYWIKFEILWREYFYWLYNHHGVDFFRSEGLHGGDFKLPPLSVSDYLEQMNSHELITAMNRELIETGYLSNRSRQIYVSYLVHHTELDWRYGAWFFQHHLKDYDVYSNWGNWLYGSGYGTDSRGPRYFKIDKQLKQYDPQGLYLKMWS